MTKRNAFSAVGDFLAVIGSAVAVSASIEAGRKPRSRDLHKLGIDPKAFADIRRF